MPKKTRQEKILARLRRLEKDQEPTTASEQNLVGTTEIPKVSFQLKTETNPAAASTIKATSFDYSYVYKDITKSLFFAAVAVILQIILAIFVIK